MPSNGGELRPIGAFREAPCVVGKARNEAAHAQLHDVPTDRSNERLGWLAPARQLSRWGIRGRSHSVSDDVSYSYYTAVT